KRAGALFTIPELIAKGYSGADLRLYLLRTHYRSPLPFDLSLLDEGAKTRAKLDHFVHYEMAERPEGPDDPAVARAIDTARRDFAAALEDDLNTSVALAVIHAFMTAVNRAEPRRADAQRAPLPGSFASRVRTYCCGSRPRRNRPPPPTRARPSRPPGAPVRVP